MSYYYSGRNLALNWEGNTPNNFKFGETKSSSWSIWYEPIRYANYSGFPVEMRGLNSVNFGIFYPSESILILNSSVYRPYEIIESDIEIVTIPLD